MEKSLNEEDKTGKTPGDLCTAPRIISLSSLSLTTDVTDATIGASGLRLETRTGTGGTAPLLGSYFGRSPWLHGEQVQPRKN
jgi:hypothetical protein